MRITIDTKEDSHEDIKQILNILSNIIQSKDQSSVTKSVSVDTTNMMSMFESNTPEQLTTPVQSEELTANSESNQEQVVPMSMFSNPEPKKEVADTPPDFTSLLNLAKSKQNQEKDDEEPKVQLF